MSRPSGPPPLSPEPGAPPDSAKPGLVAERTRLAWLRTNLAVIIVTLLVTRLALIKGIHAMPWVARSIIGAALGCWIAFALVSFPRLTGRTREQADGAGFALPLVALITVGFATLGVLFILAGLT
ncbi:DUF202 domain-containing protein [Micromonospora sp. NPDC003197]